MAYFLASLAVGALGLAIFFVYSWLAEGSHRRTRGCQAPPRRRTRDPVLGLGYKISYIRSSTDGTVLPIGQDLHREYGSTYQEPSIFGTTLKTANEDNVHTIFGLKAAEWGVRPFRYNGMRPFCGDGLISTDGHIWEHSRSLLKPSFHKSNVSDLTFFERSVKLLLEQLPIDGSTVDMEQFFSTLVILSPYSSNVSSVDQSLQFVDTASHFVLGESLGLLQKRDPKGIPVSGEAFLKAWQLSLLGCGMRIFFGPFRALIPGSMTTMPWQVAHKYFDYYVDKALIAKDQEKHDSLRDHHNVINATLHLTNDRLELRNQAIQAMMAAQDTLPMLLCNTLFCLSRSPNIWDRLRAEVASVGPDALTIEEARKFKLLRNILSESLRMYPVFPVLARDALVDTVLPTGGGPQGDKPVFAPGGTRVIADFYTLFRDESIFGSNASVFDPDRWDTIHPGPWQNMTFGGGMRACLGRHKALGEASCTLIRLAQKFKRIESRDDRDWAGALQLVARNIHGCKVALIQA